MDVIKPKKFWTKQKIALTGLGVALVAFIIYLTFFSDKRSKLNVDADKITISDVKEGNFDEFIIVQGAVQPLKTIRLDAIVGGYVTQKLVEGGTKVGRGDIILRLENQQLKLNFLQSETEANRLVNDLQNTRQRLRVEKFTLRKTLAELDFQIDQAKDAFERNKKLIKDNVISEAEFQKSKREYERQVNQRNIEVESQKYQEENSNLQIKQLEGTLQRTQKNVDLWRETLENLVVKAPVSGLLSSIDVEVGSNISQGQNIGQIDDLDGFKMRSDIDEHYISRIFPGLRGSFEFNGKSHEIEIIKVYPEVKNGRFAVDMTFTGNSPDGIRRGQSSPVRLELGKAEKAVLIPVGGFFSDTGGNWIYVVDASGKKAVKRNISLGRKNPEYFEVLSGLKSGEKVITSGYENFGDKEVLVF
ncbi:efflux RND transporter periplasmic adaptor subunit [Lacihabitans sp. CS3-21]|jgi:HlyD family secretion protein|uniref:efflux RND transporter periplasmic adaptor subunit n=1 Tax=Lacihabitans sp. CS3-21 TaxID=2487332 RepID=UPI0020CC9DB7|nr:efflux RND transporter periplasmic adaptor subunit [Lacihabitans sp. CS3-21]MCP9749134.1 efflux RND transporter periplasmic adaptor subunit [Lacihabitans sp. CS3-21]